MKHSSAVYCRRYYASKRARGLCCKCQRPAKLKRDGKRASMCAKHLHAVKLITARLRAAPRPAATGAPVSRVPGRPAQAAQRVTAWPDYPTRDRLLVPARVQPSTLGRCSRCLLAGEHVCLPSRASDFLRSADGPTYPAPVEPLSSRLERKRIDHYAPAPVYARLKRPR